MTAPGAEAFSTIAGPAGRIGAFVTAVSARGCKPSRSLAVLALIALVLQLIAAIAASAEEPRPLKGVALVIGEATYQHLAILDNPDDDARAIKRLLDGLGFDARDVVNRDGKTLRRDLDRFVEDAAGADVALVYFSGHGIEAGGENWLIPVDADASALEKAGERLISLSAYLERLQQTVPLAIILLDACRSSPFPSGASLKPSSAASPAPVGVQGLSIPAKGMTVIEPAAPASTADGSATLLGFAAAPGNVALDGPSDGNSPYATALLRHLAAKGLSLGDVMTLVSQEVYVETQGRQVPWTNHNLRQFLYFGIAAESADGDEAAIRNERRGLLLTIAALPEDRKRLVEGLARDDQVPLDALYGMLSMLEIDGRADEADLDKRLRAGSEKLKSFLAERQAVHSSDTELARLSARANEAVDEGAIKTAIGFHEKAKARIAALSASVAQAKADVKARELEFAQTFAASAETNILAFDYLKAAADYDAAYEKAWTWDRELAFTYRFAQADALTRHGSFTGDNAAIERAIATYSELLGLAPRERAPLDWARVQNDLGIALATLGDREKDPARLEKALAAYHAALEERTQTREPLAWASTQSNFADALAALGSRESGTARLEEAVAAYGAALAVIDRARMPLAWARVQNSLGSALLMIGERENSGRLYEAIAAQRATIEIMTRERMPLDWARAMEKLGDALQILGEGEAGTERLDEAVTAYEGALAEITRARMPLAWAALQNSLGNVLSMLGERENDAAQLETALGSYRNALAEWTRDGAPLHWAMAQNNLGTTLQALGERETGTARLQEAVAAYRAALKEMTAQRVPRDWAMTQKNLGTALLIIGMRDGSRKSIEEAKLTLTLSWDLYRSMGEDWLDDYFADKMAQIESELAKPMP